MCNLLLLFSLFFSTAVFSQKEKIDFITYALVSNQSWIKISAEEGDELGDMINDLQVMDNQELKEATKEIRKVTKQKRYGTIVMGTLRRIRTGSLN